MNNSLCFVLMPFGTKVDSNGREIQFDAIYESVIKPAIEEAGLEPIRADEEIVGGIIHKPMFERLVLCAYAVADLTLANANVFYELGVRHAVRPWRTVTMFADGNRLPFDVNYLRSLPYKLAESGIPVDAVQDRARLVARLEAARQEAAEPSVDSPVFQLLDYLPRPTLEHEKTDLFRAQVKYSAKAKTALSDARAQKSSQAVNDVIKQLRPLGELDAGVVIDAMLSFRAVEDWGRMVAFIEEEMPRELQATAMVQEQLGFALNRVGKSERAERVLTDLVEARGPSPETLGILGRVFKDRWHAAKAAGNKLEAGAHLEKAIDAYVRGFEADFRDAYPGVNALTLLDVHNPSDDRIKLLQPIVAYAVRRKMASKRADYWDHATLLELAVLSRSEVDARESLGRALTSVREGWEPKTTARNLAFIRDARRERGETLPWAEEIERAVRQKGGLPPELP